MENNPNELEPQNTVNFKDTGESQPDQPVEALDPLQESRRAKATNLFEWMEALISSLVVVVLLFSFVFRVVNVSGSSMMPNLHNNDRVVLSSYFYVPKAGDVVVITRTEGLNKPIIKRIIATEGQTVNIDFQAGRVYVDGVMLDESAYIKNGITTQSSDFTYPVTVPEDHVFVLGDNRPVSEDSRSCEVGMVDTRYILGKAEWVVFPFDRFGSITGD